MAQIIAATNFSQMRFSPKTFSLFSFSQFDPDWGWGLGSSPNGKDSS